MSEAKKILEEAYKLQTKAKEKLREIYNCGQDFTEEQRNIILDIVNAQDKAAIHLNVIRKQ